MNKGLEALKELKKETRKGGQYYIVKSEKRGLHNIIEQELKECEMEHTLRIRLENVNYELVRENEKLKKALGIIKELFGFDFALRFPNNQPMLRITNKRTNEYWELPISQNKYNLLKEVLL